MAGRTGCTWTQAAIPGQSWTLLAGYGGLAPFGNSQRSIGVFLGGQSDIFEAVDGDTGAEAYADLIAYVALCRAAGCTDVILATIPPWTGITAGEATARNDYNTLIRASVVAGDADAVVDLDAVPELSDPANLTYYVDGIHWALAGATVAAATLDPVLDAVLAA